MVDSDSVLEEEELDWESTGFFFKVRKLFYSILMSLNDTVHDLKPLNFIAQRMNPNAHKFSISDAEISEQNADCDRVF